MKKIFAMMAEVLLIAGQAVAAGSNDNLDFRRSDKYRGLVAEKPLYKI